MGFTAIERKYLGRNSGVKHDLAYKNVILLIIGITILSVAIHLFVEPKQVHADMRPPMTNKEICEYIRDNKYAIPPGHMGDTVKLCAGHGVKL